MTKIKGNPTAQLRAEGKRFNLKRDKPLNIAQIKEDIEEGLQETLC